MSFSVVFCCNLVSSFNSESFILVFTKCFRTSFSSFFISFCFLLLISFSGFQNPRATSEQRGKMPQTWHVCTSCHVQDPAHYALIKINCWSICSKRKRTS